MDLILWRHAEAEDGAPDAARKLTAKGEKQAARVAEWLAAHLPPDARVLVSPATRAQQTAKALARPRETVEALGPGASAKEILAAAGWPSAEGTVVVTGHQPSLGAAAALALTGKASGWHVGKGAVWWISTREGESAPRVKAVMSPKLLG